MCDETTTRGFFRKMSLDYSARLFQNQNEIQKISSSPIPVPVPIERILLSSIALDGAESSVAHLLSNKTCCISLNPESLIAIGLGKSLMVISDCVRKMVFDSEIMNVLILGSSLKRICLFTEDTRMHLIDLKLEEMVEIQDSFLEKKIALSVAVSDYQAVVATECHALYIVSFVSSGSYPRKKPQLLISASESSLGSILELQMCENRYFLAILASKSLIILDMHNLEKPKLIHKIAFHPDSSSFCQFVFSTRLLLLSSGKFFLISWSSSTPPSQVELKVPDCMHSFLADCRSLHAVADNVVLVESQQDRELQLFQVWEDRVVNTCCGVRSFVLPRNSFIIRSFQSSFSVSDHSLRSFVYSKEKGIEIHKISVLKWTEIIQSLIHCERFGQVIPLMLGIQSGAVPPLIDETKDNILTSELVRMAARKYLKSEDFDLKTFGIFASNFFLLEEYLGTLSCVLPEMVLNGQVTVGSLTQLVVSRLVKEGENNCEQLDALLAKIILDKGPDLIDTNQIVRVALALDLKLTAVLVHVHLLHDVVFPLTFLQSDERLFYLYCLSNKLRYPTWTSSEEYPPINLAEIRPDILQSMRKENEDRFFNCLECDPELFTLFTKIGGISDSLIIYGIKSAVSRITLKEFFGVVSEKECLQILLKRGQISLFLKCLEYIDTTHEKGGFDPLVVFKQLLASNTCSDSEVSNFTESKFGRSLKLDQIVHVLLDHKRNGLAVKLLAERRDFDSASKIIHNLSKDEKPNLLVDYTQQFSSFLPSSDLCSLWTDLLAEEKTAILADSRIRNVLLAKVDLFPLVKASIDIQTQNKLISLINSSHDILEHASNVSAIDVGEQFAKLAKQDSMRNKGVSITASICHVCLDPLSDAKKQDLLLFSCGHIIHSLCGDTKACSVCV